MCQNWMSRVTPKLKHADTRGMSDTPELKNMNTIIVQIKDKTYTKSAAIVRILWSMEFPWPILGWVLWIVPKPLRDIGYSIVARIRHHL